MAQDLRLLDGWVQEKAWPHVACPTCGEGFLAPQTLEGQGDAASSAARDHENWEPDWITGVFHGVLKCSAPGCGEPVVVGGDYRVNADLEPDGRWLTGEYDDFYRLRFARPAFPIIHPSPGTPDSVAEAVRGASEVIWLDPNAAANRLRFGIEELLTARHMRQSVPTKRGNRKRLSTHARIQEFKVKKPDAGEALEAVKWIGNVGSHASELTVSDVLDGAALFDFALRLLYDTKDRDLARRVKSINKSRGLPKAKRP